MLLLLSSLLLKYILLSPLRHDIFMYIYFSQFLHARNEMIMMCEKKKRIICEIGMSVVCMCVCIYVYMQERDGMQREKVKAEDERQKRNR